LGKCDLYDYQFACIEIIFLTSLLNNKNCIFGKFYFRYQYCISLFKLLASMKKCSFVVIVLFAVAASLCQAQNPILWGVAQFGGTTTNGVILNYNISTNTEKDLYNFGNSPDAQGPVANLIKASNGLLYGITISGGANVDGAMFSYDMSTGTETVLHSFGSGTDGKNPNCSLLQASDSLLYGTAYSGGLYGEGMLFSYNIKTTVYSDLHDFGSGSDGGYPSGTLIQANNGLIYGLTSLRGTNYGGGTLYKYNIKTGVETTIYNFGSGTDGAQPSGTLLQASNGLLYGVTQTGGAYYHIGKTILGGIIFSCDTNGVETDLHDFDSTDGQNPYEGLTQANDSMLYGLAHYGGTTNKGVLYSYNINSHIATVLNNFGTGTDGAYPRSRLLLASNGLLYGMTTDGGTSGAGTIFSYNITSATESVIHSFPYLATTDGAYPTGGFIEIDSSTFQVAPASPAICAGDSVNLIAAGESTYTWAPSTGLNETTGDNVFANPTVTTTYTITGNGTNTITVVVTVNPTPTITVSAPPICNGSSGTLTASGAVTYSWTPSTGLNVTTGSSVIATITAATTYIVTGTNTQGCSAADTTTVSVIPSPGKPSFAQHNDTLVSSSVHDNQWYRNDTLLTDDTSQYLTISHTGEYWVSVANEVNGCSTASDSMDISSLTGISQLSILNDQLSVYPDPFANDIFIKINSSEADIKDWSLQITDVLGRTIYMSNSLNYNNDIDLTGFPNGIYFMIVTNKINRTVLQAVKQN
jgi:uncharacterized repeat protein (TIGR03803 family)